MDFPGTSHGKKAVKRDRKSTPIITRLKKLIAKRVAPPAKINRTLPSAEIPIFSLDVTRVEEFDRNIDNLLKELNDAKPKMKEIDAKINKIDKELRKRLVEVNSEQGLNTVEICNLNQKVKNDIDNSKTEIIRLESQNIELMNKNKELEDVIGTLNNTIKEQDFKLTVEFDAEMKKQGDHLRATILTKDLKLRKGKESDVAVNIELEIENIPPVPSTSTPDYSRIYRSLYASRRRSKSVDEVSQEHNSTFGHILRPSIMNRKSVSKLTQANLKRPKYCLLAQEQGMAGDTETQVVPTTSCSSDIK